MKKFIFGQRSGIYIIDLEKTEECLAHARDYVTDITSKGDFVLFVGTKKQAQEAVLKEALRCSMFYVTERWPGGMLTNFATIKKSINRMKEIETAKEDGTYEKLTKKEISLLEKELLKLKKNFSGIAAMERMPKAMFVVDTKKEDTAVREARRLGIPVIALIDTNSDPDLVDYPIPGNDDATKSISLIASLLAEGAIDGRKRFLSYLSHEGVQIKKDAAAPAAADAAPAAASVQEPVIAPEEDAKIKEIEEVFEKTEEAQKDETKPGKRPVSGQDKSRLRKKV
jgi:small subunit ribosomal protein S2